MVAIVRTAQGADAKRLSDELFVVAQTVNDEPGLRNALSDPARSQEDKRALLRNLLEGRALPATLTLAEQALSGSYRTVSVAIAEYQKVAASVHEQSVAKVRVAQEISEDERARREVHLNVVVEPELLGGMRVEIGDDVIDGTVAARLDEARRRLVG